MKIGRGYGSEHSMNLVMIGQFKDAVDATKAKAVIDRLTEQVEIDIEADQIIVGEQTDRYSDDMLTLLGSGVNVHGIYPAELEQFAYDVSVEVEDDKVLVTTEEIDVSAFLKVLLDKGARLEVYSAHDHPGTGYGRGGWVGRGRDDMPPVNWEAFERLPGGAETNFEMLCRALIRPTTAGMVTSPRSPSSRASSSI
jgi:Family of unknown function (DUF6375)